METTSTTTSPLLNEADVAQLGEDGVAVFRKLFPNAKVGGRKSHDWVEGYIAGRLGATVTEAVAR